MPNAAPLCRGDVASARFGPDSGNDMRQATARTRAMCSAWADAFRIWATAIEPYSAEMIYRNGKVNRLPQRRATIQSFDRSRSATRRAISADASSGIGNTELTLISPST